MMQRDTTKQKGYQTHGHGLQNLYSGVRFPPAPPSPSAVSQQNQHSESVEAFDAGVPGLMLFDAGTGRKPDGILMSIGTVEPYSRRTLERVFQAATGSHDPEEFEWLDEAWSSGFIIVRKVELPIVGITKPEAKRLQYARRGAEKPRHETLKVSAAAFLQAKGLGAYQYETPVRYGRADIYFPDCDVAVEVGLCPCSRAMTMLAGSMLCVVPYRKNPQLWIFMGGQESTEFVQRKSHERMERFAI